jgi:hypothetical protein
MMYLMKKCAGKDGVLGVDNVERWPLDSAAVDFLTLISSSTSLCSLTQVCNPTVWSSQPRNAVLTHSRTARTDYTGERKS